MKPYETRKVVRSAPGWALGRPRFRNENGQAKVEGIDWVSVVAWEVGTGDTRTSAWPILALESIKPGEAFMLKDPEGQLISQEYIFANEAQAFIHFQRRHNGEAKAQSQSS